MSALAPPTPAQRTRRAVLALIAVTIIWGWTFIWMKQAVQAGEATLGAGAGSTTIGVFMLLRFAFASLVLLLFVPAARRGLDRTAVTGGAAVGGALLVGFFLQMFGLEGVTPAVSAFLTSLYVVFTALVTAALERKAVGLALLLGTLLATFGAGFIGGPPQLTFGRGEWLTVASAFAFALQILATDRFTRRAGAMPVTLVAFLVITIGSAIFCAWSATRGDGPSADALRALLAHRGFWIPLLCTSLLGSVIAISLMNLFQRELDPVRAAILYALEPVWAAAFSIMLGLSIADRWLWIGGGALLSGNLIAELGPLLARRRAASRA